MKLDLIAAAAKPVEDFEDRGMGVRSLREGKHLSATEAFAQRNQPVVLGDPCLTCKCVDQRRVRREQVVIDELARLVRHIVRGACHLKSHEVC